MIRWFGVFLCCLAMPAIRVVADTAIPEGSHSAASSGIGLETDTYGTPSALQPLEARYRTFDFGVQSTRFVSTKPRGMFIIFH